MSYNLDRHYRCTIIRGRGQSQLEDFLPLYVSMVSQSCPSGKEEFKLSCQKVLSNALFGTSEFDSLTEGKRKTINNHITEIAGALLGLYYPSVENGDVIMRKSQTCAALQEQQDYPAFFRGLCLNFQFPNGARKPQSCIEDLRNGIRFKPYCFIVKLLLYAQDRPTPILLSMQEIGFYALSNLEVLQGRVSCEEVYDAILSDRANGVRRTALHGSNEWQHIKELFNWLSLTNMTVADKTYIWLNPKEAEAIRLFAESEKSFGFDAYSYDFNSEEARKRFYNDWKKFYSSLPQEMGAAKSEEVVSPVSAAVNVASRQAIKSSTDLGDEGEALVYRLEVERVKAFKPRLANKVLLLGKTKGLGYDVLSIEADEMPQDPEMNRFIEVKSTRRTTEPNFDLAWIDSVNLTAKEWLAARQHGRFYNVYRVYFTRSKVIVVRVNNPYQLAQESKVEVYPTNYQMDFSGAVIEKRYVGEQS